MQLTQKESGAKALMENLFIPALHDTLSKAAPEKYQQWGGNACRQTAIFGANLLKDLLPEYDWVVWDGNFSDMLKGKRVKYNHAWIYGIHKTEKKGLLVDLSRNHHERLFLPTKSNKYPKDNPTYKNMKLINKTKLDYQKEMLDIEYYTSKRGTEVFDQILMKIGSHLIG